jgi:hypothetical protein
MEEKLCLLLQPNSDFPCQNHEGILTPKATLAMTNFTLHFIRQNAIATIFLAFFVFSCDDSTDSDCNVSDPLEELPWLMHYKNSLSDCACTVTIFEGKYFFRTVYFSLMNDPLCNSVFGTTLYDCHGKAIKSYGSGDLTDFGKEVQIGDEIYICHD